MRIGFHYHVPAIRDDHGQIWTPGYQGMFLDSLAGHCEHLVCFLHEPKPGDRARMDYRLQSANVDLVSLGSHDSVPGRVITARRRLRGLEPRLRDLDVLLLRGPSPLVPAMARAARGVPIALLIVGDHIDSMPGLRQPEWRRQAMNLFWRYNRWAQTRIARRALTFVNNRHLFDRLRDRVPNLIETRTTTLRETDVYERPHEPLGRPVRLLYTGRMDRAKGLFELVAALAWLRDHCEDVTLDLVGWAQPGDPVVEDLLADAARMGVREQVVFHGYVPAGDALMPHYRNADIYVSASTGSEGFPRTLWEAMANSLPIVATRVGSIPSVLEEGVTARLVEPNSVDALGAAIQEIIHDESLRRALSEGGPAFARENTLERRADEMIAALRRWQPGAKRCP